MKTSDVREPGWYWVRDPQRPWWRVMKVIRVANMLNHPLAIMGDSDWTLLGYVTPGAEWVGPLREPEEVKA